MEIPSYVLDTGLYLTKARSSFCRDTAVYCATTMDLNPDAVAPSASIPFMPKTDLRDTLKTYGDAPVTVSVSMVTLAPETFPVASRVASTSGNR